MSVKTFIRPRPRSNGEMSYQITVDYGSIEDLKDGEIVTARPRFHRTIRGTEAEAIALAERLRLEAEGKDPFAFSKKQGKITLSAWNSEFISKYTPNIQESTRAGYIQNLSYFNASPIGKIALQRLSSFTLQKFFDSLLEESPKSTGEPLSPRTIRHIHSAVNLSLKEAVRNGIIDRNPAEGIRLPKRDAFVAGHYEQKELKRILKAARKEDPQIYLMIALFVYTGIRRGEGCGLRFSDVNFRENFLTIRNNRVRGEDNSIVEKCPKSVRGNRQISIPDALIKLIKEERKRRKINNLPSEYVLSGKNGNPLAPDTVSRYWRFFLSRHPKIRPLRLHDLRHSQMCLLLDQGITPAVAAARLGDTTGTAMNAYAHSSPTKEKYAGSIIEQALTI